MPQAAGYTNFSMTDKLGEDYEKELAIELVRDFEQLKNDRGNLDSHLREISARIWPMHKNLFDQLNQANGTQGEKRNQEVLDSTGIIALERFGAIMDSMLTPRNSFWHSLTTDNPILKKDKNSMDWFAKSTAILFQQRYAPKANFSSQNQLQYKSLGAYGTGGMFIDDLMGEKGIRYKNCHIGEVYIRENHQGLIDGVCRHFKLSARQALKLFGDNCPEDIAAKAETNPEDPNYFLHWVISRTDRDPERKDFKGMEFASYYVALQKKQIIGEGGYTTFPYSISRYEQCPGEVYGRSPAMNVLPSLKMLNKQKELVLKQGQLAVDPVMLLHDDGIMDGASIESGTHIAGAVSADGKVLVHTLPSGRLDIAKEMMEDERTLINDTFLVRLFQILVDSPEMTATEVAERAREKGILLAPTIGRQQSEYLGPMIERELDILSRQQLLPPMPRMLQEAQGDYTIIYDSPITRTQKAEWTSGAMRSIEMALNVAAQMQDPSKLFYFNWDAIIPEAAQINGTPSTWMNSPEVVAQLKAAAQKQQQTQQMIEAAPAAAGMMKAAQ